MARPVPFHNPNSQYPPQYPPHSNQGDSTFYNAPNGPWSTPQDSQQHNYNHPPSHHQNPPVSGVGHSSQPQAPAQAPHHPMSNNGQGGVPNQSSLFSQMSSDPIHQYATQQALAMLYQQTGNYLPGAYSAWNSLRYYFAVNNSYVLNKMKILLLPFRHRGWRRQILEDTSGAERIHYQGKYALPSHDINAPDLYIPLMSFVTFILIVGYTAGASGEFSPDIIGEIASYCLAIQIVEIVLLKFGLSMLQCKVPILDLLAFSGYKYVGLVINMAGGVLMGRIMYYVCLTYTGSMISYFMLNSLKGLVPEPGQIGRNRRNYTLLTMAFGQFVLMWWMAYSGKL